MSRQLLFSKLIEICLIVVLVSLGICLYTYKLTSVSVTYDEGFSYLGNGEYLVKNFRWDRPYILLHPPLSYYLHGWSSLVFPVTNMEQRLYIARLSMLPIYILFAAAIYLVIRRFFGRYAGFAGLVLYLFNPEILSHSRLITPDHLLAFFIFTTFFSFIAYLRKNSFWRFLVISTNLGFALLSKYNGLLLVPLLIFLGTFYVVKQKASLRNIFTGLIGMFIIAILMLHVGYLFKETGRLPETFVSPLMQQITNLPITKPLLTVIFPRAYLEGADFQMFESSKGVWWGYFKGEYYPSGLWYFYPAVFTIKTPLPLLILIVLAAGLLLVNKIGKQSNLSVMIMFSVLWFFVYMMFFNKLIIGLRYLLMVYPLLIVFVVPLFTLRHKRWVLNYTYRIVLIILLIWYVLGTVKIAPFYLAYANETIGGPKNLWKYVADSSLDWNQDQIFFQQYRNLHPEIKDINPHQPTKGKIAVNVNDMSLYHFYEYIWLRNLQVEPVDYVGYTWLIFDIK